MKRLTEDAANMVEIMERTGERSDIWQDRFIYYIARAIYDLIDYIRRKEARP